MLKNPKTYLVLKVGFYLFFFKALNTRLLQQPKQLKDLQLAWELSGLLFHLSIKYPNKLMNQSQGYES